MDYNKNYNETKKLQIGITCSYIYTSSYFPITFNLQGKI